MEGIDSKLLRIAKISKEIEKNLSYHSHMIKMVEARIKGNFIKENYSYLIEHKDDVDSGISSYFEVAKCPSAQYQRLFFRRTEGGRETLYRPFIETNSAIRLEYAPYLSGFLDGYHEHLNKKLEKLAPIKNKFMELIKDDSASTTSDAHEAFEGDIEL